MSPTMVLLVEAVTDFIITGGAVLTGYMTAHGAIVMPSGAAIVLTVIAGLVGAANQVRGRMKNLPPAVAVLAGLALVGLAGCATLAKAQAGVQQAVGAVTLDLSKATAADVDMAIEMAKLAKDAGAP